MQKNILSTFSFILSGCSLCYYLQLGFFVSPILSSALVGLIGSFVPESRFYNFKIARSSIYASSFLAMTSDVILQQPFELFILSFFLSVFFLLSQKHFKGFGGKLGAQAFTCVVLFRLLKGF